MIPPRQSDETRGASGEIVLGDRAWTPVAAIRLDRRVLLIQSFSQLQQVLAPLLPWVWHRFDFQERGGSYADFDRLRYCENSSRI